MGFHSSRHDKEGSLPAGWLHLFLTVAKKLFVPAAARLSIRVKLHPPAPAVPAPGKETEERLLRG